MTGELLQSWGYAPDPTCPLCGEVDDQMHRLCGCKRPAKEKERLDSLFGHVEAGDLFKDCLWIGLPPGPKPLGDWSLRFWTQEEGWSPTSFVFDVSLPIFTDGACHQPAVRDMARSGCGAVQVDREGALLRALYSPLPARFPQSAIMAEHGSLVLASLYCPPQSSPHVVVDCMALHIGATKPQQALSCSSRFGGFWREVDRHLAGGWPTTQWTKSHRDFSRAKDQEEEFLILGNSEADRHAGWGAELHGLTRGEVDEHLANLKVYNELLEAAGLALGRWPAALQLWGKLARAPRPTALMSDRPFATQHRPVWVGNGYRCGLCLKRVRPSTKISCRQVPAVVHDAINATPPLGHRLHVAWTLWSRLPCVFCLRCGASTTGTHAPNLHKPCKNKATSELRQLRRGKVPGSRHMLGPVMPLLTA